MPNWIREHSPKPETGCQKGHSKAFFFFNTIHVNSLAYHIIGCYPINSRNTLLLSYYFQKCFGYRNFHFRSFPLKIPKLKDFQLKFSFLRQKVKQQDFCLNMEMCNQNNSRVRSSWDNVVNSTRMFMSCPSCEVFGR